MFFDENEGCGKVGVADGEVVADPGVREEVGGRPPDLWSHPLYRVKCCKRHDMVDECADIEKNDDRLAC